MGGGNGLKYAEVILAWSLNAEPEQQEKNIFVSKYWWKLILSQVVHTVTNPPRLGCGGPGFSIQESFIWLFSHEELCIIYEVSLHFCLAYFLDSPAP